MDIRDEDEEHLFAELPDREEGKNGANSDSHKNYNDDGRFGEYDASVAAQQYVSPTELNMKTMKRPAPVGTPTSAESNERMKRPVFGATEHGPLSYGVPAQEVDRSKERYSMLPSYAQSTFVAKKRQSTELESVVR